MNGKAQSMNPCRVLVIFVLFGLLARSGSAATWYVATNGSDGAAGTNWATAKQTIQAGVNLTAAGDTVLVNDGVYSSGTNIPTGYLTKNRVFITNNITVQSVNGPSVTRITGYKDAGHSLSAIRCVLMKAGTLSGFTLFSGSSCMYATNTGDQHGGGLLVLGGEVSNCVIASCSAETRGGGVYGGTLRNCTICSNQSSGTVSGRGIGGGTDASTLIGCTVYENIAYITGGGVADGTATDCILRNNDAMGGYGGGASGCTLYNCLLTGNTAWTNGGGAAWSTLYNCTVCNNNALQAGGGEDGCSVYNSILINNTAMDMSYPNWYTAYAIEHSCTSPDPGISGVGNITNDPQFVSGYHLQATSPCIDAGDNARAATNTPDLDGNARVVRGTVDMGAYEVQMATITVVATGGTTTGSGTYFPGTNISITATGLDGHWLFQQWSDGDTNALRTLTVPLGGGTYSTTFTQYTGVLTFLVATNGNDLAGGLTWPAAKRTIQAAVDGSWDGDTVLVTNGVYSTGVRPTPGYSTSNRLVITNNILVQSVKGPASTSIVGWNGGSLAATDSVRCVFLTNGVLSGFTLTNGATPSAGSSDSEHAGGGAFAIGGVLTNCVIAGCISGDKAGGVLGGTLHNCVLSGNTSAKDGGGGAGGAYYDCVISGNTSLRNAGGLMGSPSTVFLRDCTISSNRAAEQGGGVLSGILTNCTISGNRAAEGGGIYNCTLDRCLVTGNAATNGGGTRSGTLYNCLLTGNTAVTGGAATAGTLVNCTIVGNTATNGGGVYDSLVRNSIVWSNRATTGANYAGSPSFSYSCTTPTNSGTGNTANDPMFVDPNANYRLGDASPCINAGNNAYAQGLKDLEGTQRVMGGTVDMGAYEHAGTTPLIWYVKTSGSDTANGWSWSTAKRTVQAAVDGTVDGDTVLVTNGVYSTGVRATPGYSTSNRVVITNDIRVQSVKGPSLTSIVGWNGGAYTVTDSVRCVYITNGTLSGFTLANGAAPDVGSSDLDHSGGGAFAMGATLTNCILTNCVASERGGGVIGGTLVNCVLSGNRAVKDGGGAAGSCLYTCTISGNTSERDAGGVVGQPTTSLLLDCTISSNQAVERGGGVASCVLTNCVLSGNAANEGGGASSSTLDRCDVTGNTATNGGGTRSSTLYNCLLTGNTAVTGGAVYAGTLVNCTIVGNTATNGGGVYSATVRNGIVWSNYATIGANYAGSPAFVCTCTTPLPSGSGNFTNDPRCVDAGAGNYRLQSVSPCLDVGSNRYVQGTYDRDGQSRVFNGIVDLGAYECQAYAPWTYNAWAAAITNGLTNITDCATGDGYPNLLKYATGSSATQSDDLAEVDCAREHGFFVMYFNRNTNAGDVTLFIESAAALTNDATWSGVATNVNGTGWGSMDVVETGTGTPVSVSVTDEGAATNRFLRVRVTKP